MVVVHIASHGRFSLGAPGREFNARSGRQHRWKVLHPDHVFRRCHAAAGVIGQTCAVDNLHAKRVAAEVEQPSWRYTVVLGHTRKQAAQLQGDLCLGRRRSLRRQRRHRVRQTPVTRDVVFRQRDEFNHPLVALAGGFAPAEDAVLLQQHAFTRRMIGHDFLAQARQVEARHHIRHPGQSAAIDLLAQGFAIGLVRDHVGGERMGVVDEFVRQVAVQQGFYRRCGCLAIEQGQTQRVDHVFVRECVELTQLQQGFHAHGGVSVRFDHRKVAAAAFDAQHSHIGPEQVLHRGLDGGVATTVQHQLGVAPEQSGAVGAQGQVGTYSLGAVVINALSGFIRIPQTLHFYLPEIGC